MMRANPKADIQQILGVFSRGDTRAELLALFYSAPQVWDHLFPTQYRKMAVFPGGPFHLYDPANHCFLCAALMESCGEPWKKLAAFLHDVGKADTRTMDEKGDAHYYRHEFVGAAIAQSWFESFGLENWEAAGVPVARVVGLIRWHMFDMFGVNKTVVTGWLKEFDAAWIDTLYDLRMADWGAAKTTQPEWDDLKARKLQVQATVNEIALEKLLMDSMLAEGKAPTLAYLAIKGDDLLALGMKPGPVIGELLRHLQSMVNSGDLPNTKEALVTAILSEKGI